MARHYRMSEAEKTARSARMKARHADPAYSPLAALTPAQRADYDLLRRKGGYSRAEALAAVLTPAAAETEAA